jgi:pimeloyl-ACP methyl ester carboxylesterase
VKRLRTIVGLLIVLVMILAVLGSVSIVLREPDDGASVPADVPGRLLDVAGMRVHVVERGAGPVVLLVHGFGASADDWEQFVLEPLARTHRAIAVDLLGLGWSERRDDFDYGWTFWADQLAGVLDVLDVERASVAGQSMGGAVAAVFAARHPERIDRLVLVDALYPRAPSEAPLVFRALQTPVVGELALGFLAAPIPPGFGPDYTARARRWYRIRGTRRGMLHVVRDRRKAAELAAAYPKIAAPTLIVHDPADPFVAYATMERTAPMIRDARIVTIPGGGHFPERDKPDELVRLLDDFLH